MWKTSIKTAAEAIKQKLQKQLRTTWSDLIHCDETGARVDGKTLWVHDASNADYTFLSIKRMGTRGISPLSAQDIRYKTFVSPVF